MLELAGGGDGLSDPSEQFACWTLPSRVRASRRQTPPGRETTVSVGGQVSWAEYLFSSAGRIGRRSFLVGALGLLALGLAIRSLTPSGLGWTGWILNPPLLFCAACLVAKRLHDVGRTGWWGGVILLSVMILWGRPQGLGAFVSVLVLTWAGVELLLLPGQPDFNRYGPRGVQPQGA